MDDKTKQNQKNRKVPKIFNSFQLISISDYRIFNYETCKKNYIFCGTLSSMILKELKTKKLHIFATSWQCITFNS